MLAGMPQSSAPSKGVAAALGPRQRIRGLLRTFLVRQIGRWERRLGSKQRPQYLHFVPPVRTSSDLADLSARVNWYLAPGVESMPIYVDGLGGREDFTSDDAWYMDPKLVSDPGWFSVKPKGRRRVVVYRTTAGSLLDYARHARHATLAAPDFGYGADESFFTLGRLVSDIAVPSPAASIQRLLTRKVEGGSAFVLATGPSANMVDPGAVTEDIRITCNSAVRDHDLLDELCPDVIAFGDPVFHCGPSRYAAAFRRDLEHAVENTDALILTTNFFVEPLLHHVPQIRDRLVVLTISKRNGWRWPTVEQPQARATGNVLTNLMLPAAFALSDNVVIAGCDGRVSSERYYWRHNRATQYDDELMRAAFEAHPAFFRDRDYGDYYDRHCRELEEFFEVAEAAGKRIQGLTPSYVPALLSRGAPPFEDQRDNGSADS